MSGLVGKKIGMTSIYAEDGRSVPVTVIEVPDAVVTQIKTADVDGYDAIQVASFDKKEKNVSKALMGHLNKADAGAKRVVREFRGVAPEGMNVGDVLKIDDVFTVGSFVHVAGKSKGRGFSGVVRRHNFGGVGDQTHGQHNRLRSPGSIGQSSDPSRVFKGIKMAGRYGNERIKVRNLQVAKIMSEENILLITGSIPGTNGGFVEITNLKTEDSAA
jgi:large subunit ribosomal protein L3